jgi:eukaryotic-like serine/threonine-protein kinase
MATVHFGRLQGAAGFARSVAIKRLHPQFAKDPDFVAMFVDEARLAARIAHPNVVPTLDVVSQGDELLLIMEYVRGASLSRLLRILGQRGERVPLRIAASIVSGVLYGLHAAHEAKNETGERLDIVHRDVSPQNVLVGTDGVARVLDFGVAKAAGRWHSTRQGQLKGKIAYMAPEQINTGIVTRKTDLYAAAVVLWETLTGRRLFRAENEAMLLATVLDAKVEPPSHLVAGLPEGFDRVVLRGLESDPENRFATAREMASEVEAIVGTAPPAEIGEWVERVAADELRERANRIEEIERSVPSAPSVGSVPSAVSSAKALSFAGSEPPRPKPRRVPIAIGAAALVLVTMGVTLLAVHTSRSKAGLARGTPAAVDGESPAARPGPPPAVISPSGPPSSVLFSSLPPPPAPSAAGATVAAPPPPTPAPTTRAGRSSGAIKAPIPAPRPVNADCSPPYETDTKGHIHFKPACLN